MTVHTYMYMSGRVELHTSIHISGGLVLQPTDSWMWPQNKTTYVSGARRV